MQHRSLALFAVAATFSAIAVAQPDTPAALVNDVAIERAAVQHLVKGLARAEPSPPDSQRIAALNRSALESLIDLELLHQEAERNGIALAEGEVEKEVANLKKHFSTQQDFEAALASRGLTPSTLRQDTRRTLLATRLLQETVWRDLRVDSDEVELFFNEHEANLDQTIEQLQDSIARMLLDEKKAALRADLLRKLRKKAAIKRFPPFAATAPATAKRSER